MNRTVILLAAAAVGVLALGAARDVAAPAEAPQDDRAPLDVVTDWTHQLYEELDTMPQAPTFTNDANRAAFLSMIAACEGTDKAGGYACLYGSTPASPKTFSSFADHPRIVSHITATDTRWTSAAGRYQFMAVSPIPGGGSTRVDTWDRLKAKLNLPDFSPASQDRAAIELVAECGALEDVDAGRVLEAARKCRRVWASLPGANYEGQGMRSPSFVVAAYQLAGGAVA